MVEIAVGSKETYSKEDVRHYLDEFDSAVVSGLGDDYEVAFKWNGPNIRSVFRHLAEHGWIITSMDKAYCWLERVA